MREILEISTRKARERHDDKGLARTGVRASVLVC